jgi:group I intron endonuclease
MNLKWKIRGSVYYIRHKESGKGYVGQHNKPDPKERWARHKCSANKGSNLPFHRALRKYGYDAFTWEVLGIFPYDALTIMEGYYAEVLSTYIWDYNPGGYNAVWCSENFTIGLKHTPEHIEKIRQAGLGRKQSPEAIEKQRITMTGRRLTPEALEAHHKAHLGRKKTPEELEKLRLASTGKKQTPEIIAKAQQNRSPTIYTDELREKLRIANLGRKHTDESRANMSKSQTGRKHSDETLAKMKEVHKGKAYCKGVPKSDEWKEKMRKPKTEEHKEKMRQARLAYWAKKRESTTNNIV